MSSESSDRVIIDMPTNMARRVLLKGDDGKWVPDPNWHQTVRAMYLSVVDFLQENQLLVRPIPDLDIADLVLKESDLTDRGKAFWRTNAVRKWLGSFDRNPSKDVRNHTQLTRALNSIL